jgi:hypothetical protein
VCGAAETGGCASSMLKTRAGRPCHTCHV